jgi:DNA polymerase-3 subunit gamma/tau
MHDQVKEVSAAYLNQIFDLLFKEEPTVKFSANPKMALELAFIRIFQVKPALSIDFLIDSLDRLRQELSGQPTREIHENTADESETEDTIRPTKSENHPEQRKPAVADRDISQHKKSSVPVALNKNPEQAWHEIYEIISDRQPSLAANLAKARLKRLTEQRLEIEVDGNGFVVDMIKRNKHLDIIKTVCRELFGKDMEIIITAKKIPSVEDQKKKSNDLDLKNNAISHPRVADAIEIFNGQIVDVKIKRDKN